MTHDREQTPARRIKKVGIWEGISVLLANRVSAGYKPALPENVALDSRLLATNTAYAVHRLVQRSRQFLRSVCLCEPHLHAFRCGHAHQAKATRQYQLGGAYELQPSLREHHVLGVDHAAIAVEGMKECR